MGGTQYEVKLNNGVEMIFDKNFALLKIDDTDVRQNTPVHTNTSTSDATINRASSRKLINDTKDLPTSIQQYLNQNYKGIKPLKLWQDEDEYEIRINDSTYLEFNSIGEFKSLKIDKNNNEN